MPLLFSLEVHNALTEVQAELLPGEFLFAFLDDVYLLCLPERTRKIHDLLAEKFAIQSRNWVAHKEDTHVESGSRDSGGNGRVGSRGVVL